MKLRPPAVPLITVDPYFSVWSPCDRANDADTIHWTSSPMTLRGSVKIDGEEYAFLGNAAERRLEQVGLTCTALVTEYAFSHDTISLCVTFFTPLLPDDLDLLSRPVSFMRVRYSAKDGKEHNVSVKISVSEEICINKKGEMPVETEILTVNGLPAVKMGSVDQKVLWRDGDDVRIDWGYFYLVSDDCDVKAEKDDMTFVTLEKELLPDTDAKILFAYDDIKSIRYFGTDLDGYWKKKWASIEDAIADGFADFDSLLDRCVAFSRQMTLDAIKAGGEKYAEMVSLAYRQVIAAHKLVETNDGELLFVSKECFSNGCAVTVDVSYPSLPVFLKYNTALLKAMVMPVLKFALSSDWEFDFAPHDIGRYPYVDGQRYYPHKLEGQMPVEECGNMLVMIANIAKAECSGEFVREYLPLLEKWVGYLEQYGFDPGSQLCTDDFAGHCAHNCNLSLKAIVGIAGFSILLSHLGDDRSAHYMDVAKKMACAWVERAANRDGSFRFAFDQEGTHGMKYNMIWDKVWKTNLFPPCVYAAEFASYERYLNPYGLPLDFRATYTKPDWYSWVACMAPTKEEFEAFIAPLWQAYHLSPSRVPLTDWYDTVTSLMVTVPGCAGFRNRTTVGAFFLKMIMD